MSKFKSETEKLLSVIFPEKCIGCGRYLDGGNRTNDFLLAPYFCQSCAGGVHRTGPNMRPERTPHAFDGIAIPLSYEDKVRDAMLSLKFSSNISSAPFFSHELEREILTKFYGVDFDIFTCVPSTKKSLAERGYNQSQLIGENIHVDAEYDFSLLRKDKTTGMQHMLTAEERRVNIESAYSLNNGRNVVGKTILLVDDIFTTGATCDSCVRTLRFAGAKAVYVACAALTYFEEE